MSLRKLASKNAKIDDTNTNIPENIPQKKPTKTSAMELEAVSTPPPNVDQIADFSVAFKFLMASMQDLMAKFECLYTAVTAAQQENQALLGRLNEVTGELDEVKKKNAILEDEIRKIKLQQTRNTIVFHGLPNGIDDIEAVKKLGNLLNVNCNDLQIDNWYRIRPMDSKKRAPLVIKFSSYRIKEALVFKRKGKSLYTTDIDIPGERTQIFVNEYLTKTGMQLFIAAKKLKSESGFKYVWSKNGEIYAKEKDGSTKINIVSTHQINELLGKV